MGKEDDYYVGGFEYGSNDEVELKTSVLVFHDQIQEAVETEEESAKVEDHNEDETLPVESGHVPFQLWENFLYFV